MDSHSVPWRGLDALVACGLFLACSVKPAPMDEEIGALSQDGISAGVKECKRLHGPGRRRDDCIRDAIHGIGECGRFRRDAGRNAVDSGRDAPGDVRSGTRDAAPGTVDGHVDTGNPDLRSMAVDGAAGRCPVITALTASALTATVGETITLNATVFAPDAGDAVTFTWFADASSVVSFDPQTSAAGTTTVTCTGAGTVGVELGVDDGPLPDGNAGCSSFETIQLTCVCPDGGCTVAPACLANGVSCSPSTGPTCCNGEICAQGICGGCLDQGAACGGGAPCCSGMACTNGICGSPACIPTGTACSPSVPCCGLLGGCANGVCFAPPLAICVADGASCNGTNPCCSGKICLGTCGACMSAGGPCNLAPAGCCTGETCVNGTCVQGACTPSGQPCVQSGAGGCCNGGCTFSNGISVCQ